MKDSPGVGIDDEISEDKEREIFDYYGISYSDRRSSTTLPEGWQGQRQAQGQQGQTMTRSEEEMRVGKRETETGRVRLRKWVETEPVNENVQLERQPINRPTSGAQIGEREIDVFRTARSRWCRRRPWRRSRSA